MSPLNRAELKIKICGLKRVEDARLAADLGAWALGFIFYGKSPRYLAPTEAARIIDSVRAKHGERIRFVGVFVNSTADEIALCASESGITTAQLHGDEPPELCQGLGLEVIKAFRLRTEFELDELEAYRGLGTFLIDSASDTYGGSGQLASWDLARKARRFGDVILAGGLTPDNVSRAVSLVEPAGVDVASGVELSPGVKDPQKLRRFFAAVRGEA